jgi:hypothetical protein
VVNAAGELGWHDRFHAGPSAPAGAIDGDLWLDDTTQTVRVRENNRWLAFNEVERFTDLNATGGAIVPGTPLVHGSPSWILAGPVTAPGSFIAIALSAAASGTRVAAGVGGIVTLSEAEWSAVIDNAEIRVVGGGLSAGRDYYVSSLSAGLLTTKPANGIGIAVGTALSSTSLLLRNSPMRSSALPTAAHIGPAPPPGRNGELWWSTIKGDLFIYFDDGTSSQWVSATADGTTTTTTTGGTPAPLGPAPGGPAPLAAAVNAVVSLEAIDWVSDPLAAAIRVHLADGSTTSLRIRGAGGTVVTMADNQTLVIDAGGGRIPSNAGTPGAGTSGAGTGTPGAGTPPTATPTGTLAPGNGVLADPITNMITTIDEGWL